MTIAQRLQWVRKFIEYARYELQPGTQRFGDQFPRQDAADRAIAEIDTVLARLQQGEEEQPVARKVDPMNTGIPRIPNVWENARIAAGGLPADARLQHREGEQQQEKDQGAALLPADPPASPASTETLPISVPVTTEELEWVLHAANLRNLTLVEYVRRAINLSLRNEGVDALLLRQSDDEA